MATQTGLNPDDSDAFRAFLAAEGQAFLERMDAWLSARAAGNSADAGSRAVRAGVGIYQIHDEVVKTGDED